MYADKLETLGGEELFEVEAVDMKEEAGVGEDDPEARACKGRGDVTCRACLCA